MRRRALAAMVAIIALAQPVRASEVSAALEGFLGRYSEQALVAAAGRDLDPLLTRWVERVGQAIAAGSPGRGSRSPRFFVLGSDAPNAFALPGGAVFVTRGLLDQVMSDDELAGILAHETAHVAHGHAARQLGANLLASVLIDRAAGRRPGMRTGLVVVNLLRSMAMSRTMERQADQEGSMLARSAGYDPSGLASFLQRQFGNQRAFLGEYLASHPGTDKRLAAIRGALVGDDDVDARAARAAGLRQRGLWKTAQRVIDGRERPEEAGDEAAPERLADEARDVVQRSGVGLRRLEGARRTQRLGGSLQPGTLTALPVDDWRWLYLSARATAVQGRLGDVLSRTTRLLAGAPRGWRRLAALESRVDPVAAADLAHGRQEMRSAVGLVEGVSQPLERAGRATVTALVQIQTRWGRLRGGSQWLRLGAVEGLLRFAESELDRADRLSARAWRLESLARIRYYQAWLDQTAGLDGAERYGLWRRLVERRWGVVADSVGSAGGWTVREALAIQLGVDSQGLEWGRGEPWADWVVTRGGVPENIATVLQILAQEIRQEGESQ